MGMVVGMDSAFGDMGFECLDQVLTESDKNARKDIKSLAVIQNLYTSDILRCMIWKRVGSVPIKNGDCQWLFEAMFRRHEDEFLDYVSRLGYNPNYRWKHYVLLE